MELADMRDLGSRAARRAGSSPVTRTTSEEANCTPLPPGRRKLHIRWLLLPFQIGGLTGGLRFGFKGSDLDYPGAPVSEIIPHGRKTAIALAVAVFPSVLPPRIGRPKTGSGNGVLLKRR